MSEIKDEAVKVEAEAKGVLAEPIRGFPAWRDHRTFGVTNNVAAFLSLIGYSEGTDKEPDAYRVCFGYSWVIKDLTYHPAEHRPPNNAVEWPGVKLDFLGPAYKDEYSTAAGRYQIIRPTWLVCKAALHLTDFTPASQDAAALFLIKSHGALELIESGCIEEAIAKCREIWASLPGSDSGQPQRRMADLITAYGGAGGRFA